MSFMHRNMSVLAYANGFTLWHYKSPSDTVEFMSNDQGYFNTCSTSLSAGDLLMITGADGGTIKCVTKVEEGNVSLGSMS